jgi:(S)-2-hydroxyglutarate dehydrogenase
MVELCSKHAIPYEIFGNGGEAARLSVLHEAGIMNGLTGLRILEGAAMRESEPHVGGIRALHVPSTGITDYSLVTSKYAAIAESAGVEIKTGARVAGFRSTADEVVVRTQTGEYRARYVVNCAGLYADQVAQLAGHCPGVRVVPFRGEYFDLAPAKKGLVRGLIYPVPDPAYPFLGVHFTKCIHGNVDAGPNAVLAFRREGYRRTDFDLGETIAMIRYSGFRRMARKHWKNGLTELRRSWRKEEFVLSCQKLVPEVRMEDMSRGGSGVRAQAVTADGTLVDDFRFVAQDRFLHVLNEPSPAATASLPIGREIIEMVRRSGGLINS